MQSINYVAGGRRSLSSRNLEEWVQEQVEPNPPICVSEDANKLRVFLELWRLTEMEVGTFISCTSFDCNWY